MWRIPLRLPNRIVTIDAIFDSWSSGKKAVDFVDSLFVESQNVLDWLLEFHHLNHSITIPPFDNIVSSSELDVSQPAK